MKDKSPNNEKSKEKIQEKLLKFQEKPGKFYSLQHYAFWLNKLSTIITKALETENPTLYFYRNDGRTPLFMLEGLSRVHEDTNRKKIFRKLKDVFKKAEDALGTVDYYDNFRALAKEKNFDIKIQDYLQKKYEEYLEQLHQVLLQDGWLGAMEPIKKALTSLEKADPEKFKDQKKLFVKNIIIKFREIEKDIKKGNYDFEDLELGIHEFRRNIRWFSIYAHAFQGLLQLKEEKEPIQKLAQYCIDSVVKSPFNKMPVFKAKGKPVRIKASTFYALSYTIEKIGELKDNAQFIHAINQALDLIEVKDESLLESTEKKLLSITEPTEALLYKAKKLITDYVQINKGLKYLRQELKNNL